MYILSGVIGVAVLTIAFRLVSLTVKESGAHGNSRRASLSWLAVEQRYDTCGGLHRVMQKECPHLASLA